MAQQSARGAGTTRAFHCASSTLWVIWTQSANSHTGRRLSSCRIKGRTDGSIRPRAATTPTFSLAWKGASTDGKLPFVSPRLVGQAVAPPEILTDAPSTSKWDDFQSHHSMTSSARARIRGGTVRPSACAVLRLMTSSILVGCWTGRSAGLAPFRILST
jgi:hypothetical protein